MRISFAFGVGTGRTTDFSTSGPPGFAISTARISFGIIYAIIAAWPNSASNSCWIKRPGNTSRRCTTRTNRENLVGRPKALYPPEPAALLGLVQLFKNGVLQSPQRGEPVRKIGK